MSSQVRARLSSVEIARPRVSSKLFNLSVKEIVAAALTLICFVAVMIYYATALKPEQDRLNALERKEEEQTKELSQIRQSANSESSNVVDEVKVSLNSLQKFRTSFLQAISEGEISLYREINALSTKHKLRLMSGIEMKKDIPNEEVE